MSRFALVWTAGLALAVAAGCAANVRRGEAFDASPRIDTLALARGEQVYMAKCQPCHPGGEAGLGPALNDKPLPGPLIALQVRAGLGAMPAFGPDQITDDELHDLVSYVIALRKTLPPR